jgi:hypothetical protein
MAPAPPSRPPFRFPGMDPARIAAHQKRSFCVSLVGTDYHLVLNCIGLMNDLESRGATGLEAVEALTERTGRSVETVKTGLNRYFPGLLSEPGKKPRKVSEYQSFVKECMLEKRDQYAGKGFGSAGPVLRECAREWRLKKGSSGPK